MSRLGWIALALAALIVAGVWQDAANNACVARTGNSYEWCAAQ